MLRQTFADFKLIVVDDCSTDGMRGGDAAEVRDPRLHVNSSPRNLGAAAARNAGIRLALLRANPRHLAELYYRAGKGARPAPDESPLLAMAGYLALRGLGVAFRARNI